MFNPNRILVLAPHTDDGELGCGGTIAGLCSEKKDVHYAAFSTCQKSLPPGSSPDTLEKECRSALNSLGMNPGNILLYDFEVREFTQARQQILEELVTLNKKIKPDLVFIPSSGDIHQDHQVIHQEARRAFKHAALLGYELPWNTMQFSPAYFSKLTEASLHKKIAALKCYTSQSHRNYMQEDFTRGLATVRGVQCNELFAEAFEVYRIIS